MFNTTNHPCQRAWKIALITAATLGTLESQGAIQPGTEPIALYVTVEKEGGLVA
jgi:hypothetical protein